MRKQIAELENRIVEIVTEHRFAEVLDEDSADRAAAVKDASVVPWTGPELVALLGVVDKCAKERGLQCCRILLEAADQVARNELRRLFREEDVAIDKIKHFHRDILEALTAD